MVAPTFSADDCVATAVAAPYRSSAFQSVMQRLACLAADRTVPILLFGESGTGKTLLARRLHDLSPRRTAKFERAVLSTLDDATASSDLFGHVAGAFTDARRARAGYFQSAAGGTVFLDEIGKASLKLQQKLLHVIERGEFRPLGSDRDVRVDVRIIAATNVDLTELVKREHFLADLHARLAMFLVRIPALRDRRADIPELARQCVRAHFESCGYAQPPAIDPELMVALTRAPWPNNIRELDGALHRIMIEARGASTLTLAHCRAEMEFVVPYANDPCSVLRAQVEAALRSNRSLSAAARELGIDRKTLRMRIARDPQLAAIGSGAPRGNRTE